MRSSRPKRFRLGSYFNIATHREEQSRTAASKLNETFTSSLVEMKDTVQQCGHLVVVVGAGPAGLFGARKLAEFGHEILIINRDIKPGGLVEYGIYFDKYPMKEGIRRKFRRILSHPQVHYLGNVKTGEQSDLTLAELRAILEPAAVVVAAGAQGTKSVGLPGEKASGVFFAKDLVYHYNDLPPYSQQKFLIGERVAIVGLGNVMVDIARYLIHVKRVREIIAVGRRGPAQPAYSDGEIKAVAANVDAAAFKQELERIRPLVEAHGDDTSALYQTLTQHANAPSKEGVKPAPARLKFRYLSQPKEILTGPAGRVRALRVEDTELVRHGNNLSARGLGTFEDLKVDTVIFAVGDSVDPNLGLPINGADYSMNPHSDPEHPDDEAYQVYDPLSGKIITGMFVMGWSRQASDGLVGKAKQDGERGIQAINRYLQKVTPGKVRGLNPRLAELQRFLQARNIRPVDYAEVCRLEDIERREAERRGQGFLKFVSNEEMLGAIETCTVVGASA